jgi:hypothetical protein
MAPDVGVGVFKVSLAAVVGVGVVAAEASGGEVSDGVGVQADVVAASLVG